MCNYAISRDPDKEYYAFLYKGSTRREPAPSGHAVVSP